MSRTVYLDYNATTPLHPRVREAMDSCAALFANPASIHSAGQAASEAVEEARERVASFFGAAAGEIVFTSGGSESNAAVFNSILLRRLEERGRGVRRGEGGQGAKDGRAQVLVSAVEHPSVREAALRLCRLGFPARFIRVDRSGKLEMSDLEDALAKPTLLVSVMAANNEIGTIQDVQEICRLAHERCALVHTDAVQAAGKIPQDLARLGVDFASISAHKIYGPKGVGALYIREGSAFLSFVPGGEQEEGRRAGTLNTVGIVGFAAALEAAAEEMGPSQARLRSLSKKLREGILEKIPGASFNGHPTDCLAGTVNVSFAGLEGEGLALRLDREGIQVSTGSACESRTGEPSAVLPAIGLRPEQARAAIRISMGRDTTESDVDFLLEKLPRAVERTRAL